MTSTYSDAPVLLVLGAGPALGLSIAHRFGREGYRVALVSRNAARHPAYLHALADAGIDAFATTADAADPAAVRTAVEAVRARFGRIDVGYFGPSAIGAMPEGILELNVETARILLELTFQAIDFATILLPEMRQRGSGGLLFAGGLSAVVPMPMLGGLAVTSAAVRNYALTLHAALAPEGVYAGTVTIGGVIDRSDIQRIVAADTPTLNPDDLAETAWQLFTQRTSAEAVINALTTV